MKKKKPAIPDAVAAPSSMGIFIQFLHFLKTPKGIAYSLVFLAIVFNAVFLMGEVTVSTFSLNDEVLHLTATQEASSALHQNQDPSDFWFTEIGLGFPIFHYYQHLPQVILAGLDQVTSSFLPLPRLFDIPRYLLLVFFPLSVFWAMRRFDFDYLAAGFSACIASLLSTNGLYGFEFGSYLWRGYGLYTQLWAMFFLPLALAEIYRTIKKEGSWFWPVFLSSLVLLSNLLYGYILVVTAILFIFLKPDIPEIFSRFKRLAGIFICTALVTAYFFIPFIRDLTYLNRSGWEAPFKYNSFGAIEVLTNLFNGNLLDYGRLPVLTLIFFLAAIVVITRWKQENYRLLLVVTLFWLLVYFGRTSWGDLVNLLPFSQDLHFHRFIGGFQLGAIMIIGAGLSLIWQWIGKFSQKKSPLKLPIVAGIAFLLLLSPVLLERAHFYEQNTQWKTESQNAFLSKSQEISDIKDTLSNLPQGRVYAGLPADFGNDPRYKIGSVPLYAIIPQLGVDSFGFAFYAFPPSNDVRLQFNYTRPEQYNLFNIRYVLLHKTITPPDFYSKIREFNDFILYKVPTTGYFDLVDVPAVFYGDKSNFYYPNSKWLFSPLQKLKQHPIIELANKPENTFGLQVFSFEGVDEKILSDLTRLQPTGGEILDETVNNNGYQVHFVVNRESYLMLKTNYHPGLDVTLDGKKVVPVMLAPGFIGIKVEPGTHQAIFSYQPPSYRLPLFVLSVLILIMLGFYQVKKSPITLKKIIDMLSAAGHENGRE
jgi:hypothetical protein